MRQAQKKLQSIDGVLNDLKEEMDQLRQENARLEQENVNLNTANRQLLDSLEEQTSDASIKEWEAIEILERHYRDLAGKGPEVPSDDPDSSQARLQEIRPNVSLEPLPVSSSQAADEAAGATCPSTPRMAPWQASGSAPGPHSAEEQCHFATSMDTPKHHGSPANPQGCEAASKAQYFMMSTPRV
jgi:hypothetical protein